jgi:CRP-like cAMP-binding protein
MAISMSQPTLSRAGVLTFMDDDARRAFTSYGNVVIAVAGQELIREGDVNTRLYIVLSGSYHVTTVSNGSEVMLDTVSIGDCVGEVAIFNPDRASATVRCKQEGLLWSIDVESLQKFLYEWPNYGCAALLGINIMLSRRLKRANHLIRCHEIVPAFLSVRAQKRTGKLA